MVANLKANFLGMRVSNIYDINGRTYLFKLAETGKEKKLLMVESGMRIHSTKYMREIPKIPSIFTLKLRKHVRSKRLEDVRQLGMDRVVDLTFGSGEAAYHIIVELHSKGNVIMTDHRYSILTLLRTFKPANSDILIATNHLYPVQAGDYPELVHCTLEELTGDIESLDQSLTLKQVVMRRYGECWPPGTVKGSLKAHTVSRLWNTFHSALSDGSWTLPEPKAVQIRS